MGRQSQGVAVVLSTMSGRPILSAMAETASRSVMTPPGLAMVSQKRARVSESIAASMAAGSSKSTNLADQPNRLIVCENCVIVPP